MRVLLIRHGRTAWNAERRLQGRADPPLDPAGEAEVRAWRLPPEFQAGIWRSSPLLRARRTALLLRGVPVRADPRLIEMDWGAFEGRTLAGLRADQPGFMAEAEAKGVDFRPPGGESPREVALRLRSLLDDLRGEQGPAVLVAHKGVQHAAMVLAGGWAMQGPPPLRLRPGHGLLLDLAPDGRLALRGLLPLVPSA
jgi:broad specificity phosphatase PhoE